MYILGYIVVVYCISLRRGVSVNEYYYYYYYYYYYPVYRGPNSAYPWSPIKFSDSPPTLLTVVATHRPAKPCNPPQSVVRPHDFYKIFSRVKHKRVTRR
jgi:hypothetical protein